MDFKTAITELPSELRRHVTFLGGQLMIDHPLLRLPLADYSCEQVVARYDEKRALADRARAECNHFKCLWLHEKPHRLPVLLQCPVHGREFWELLACVWMDSESIRHYRAKWESL
jgi:hypothetical protein